MSYTTEIYIDSDGQELTKKTWNNGSIWYTNKEDHWHRLDGPAVIEIDGYQTWYRNGKVHREDGPAYISSGGYKAWYKDGKLHREDGPTRILSGIEEYWVNGKQVSKRDVDLLWLKKQVEK